MAQRAAPPFLELPPFWDVIALMRGGARATQLAVRPCTRGTAFHPRVHPSKGRGRTGRANLVCEVALLHDLEHGARSQERDGPIPGDRAHVELEDSGLLGDVPLRPSRPRLVEDLAISRYFVCLMRLAPSSSPASSSSRWTSLRTSEITLSSRFLAMRNRS